MATDLVFSDVDVPSDETPDISSADVTGDYDPAYPGSTPEAPYGFKDDGTPYKRRPKGSGGSTKSAGTGKRNTPASESQARTAAGLLSKMNLLVGTSLNLFGLPMTATTLVVANEQFEALAYEALLTDPALCRKILSAGATSGKTGLLLAYGVLGASIAPAAIGELKSKREELDNA